MQNMSCTQDEGDGNREHDRLQRVMKRSKQYLAQADCSWKHCQERLIEEPDMLDRYDDVNETQHAGKLHEFKQAEQSEQAKEGCVPDPS